jgi:4-hydroxy-tetrahydrodipicolinate synthase
MKALDLRGLVPAPVTPFTRDGEVDHAAIQRLGSWLGSFKGVKGLVVLGHAGEGTFLTPDEQTGVIESFVKSVKGKIPVIAGITMEGTKVAALEATRAVKAGAEAGWSTPHTAGCGSVIRREHRRTAIVPSTRKAACR